MKIVESNNGYLLSLLSVDTQLMPAYTRASYWTHALVALLCDICSMFLMLGIYREEKNLHCKKKVLIVLL